MPSLNQILKAIGVALLATAVAGIVGFLAQVHLEISFDGVQNFQPTHLESYAALAKAMHLEFDLTRERQFTAFWVEQENGKPTVHKGNVLYKVFRLNDRITGDLYDPDTHSTYAITGYYNTARIVFSQLGNAGATGVYMLDVVPFDNIPSPSYAGHVIYDEELATPGKDRTADCPFVMIAAKAAAKTVPTNAVARKMFPILSHSCTEYKLQ